MRTPRRRWHKTRDAFVTFVTLWSDICKHIDDLRLALVLFVGLNDGEYRRLVWVEEVDEVDAPVQALGHVGLVGVLVPTDRRHEHALVDVKGELQVARHAWAMNLAVRKRFAETGQQSLLMHFSSYWNSSRSKYGEVCLSKHL